MIKPPFTVIVIKDTRHPVTIRVTTGIFLLLFGTIILTGILIGFAFNSLLFQKTFVFSGDAQKSRTSEFIPVQPESKVVTEQPEISRLSIIDHKKGDKELKLNFTSFPGNEKMYVWLIVNPDAGTVGEIVVYPRNPIFKGLPVDYRNGIVYLSSNGGDISINLSDVAAGIELIELHILAYSSDGELIVNQYFRENQIIKT
ncbi:hypothetical protein ACFL5B_00735 [Candidatus Latescibacterota bacterium]